MICTLILFFIKLMLVSGNVKADIHVYIKAYNILAVINLNSKIEGVFQMIYFKVFIFMFYNFCLIKRTSYTPF